MKTWLVARRFNAIDATIISFVSLTLRDKNWFAFLVILIAGALVSVLIDRSIKSEKN